MYNVGSREDSEIIIFILITYHLVSVACGGYAFRPRSKERRKDILSLLSKGIKVMNHINRVSTEKVKADSFEHVPLTLKDVQSATVNMTMHGPR